MASTDSVQPNAYARRSFLYRKLAAAGANFGEYGEGFVRFTYANSTENIKAAIQRIRENL